MELALGQVGQAELHVVAEVVEAELVVRAVGDVGAVGRIAVGVAEVVLDRPHGEAEEAVDGAHPLGVALGQVVVDRDDMDALPGQGVEVGRQGGDERFSFARLHLGDPALVEDHAADELDIEVAHPGRPARGLADDGEGLGEDILEARALGELLLEFGRFRPELVVGQGLDLGSRSLIVETRGVILLRVRSLSEPNSLREIHLYIYHYLSERPPKVNLARPRHSETKRRSQGHDPFSREKGHVPDLPARVPESRAVLRTAQTSSR